MTKFSLDGKVALVIGADTALGAAAARELARHGARVAAQYHTSFPAAVRVVRDIERQGGRAVAIKADPADPAQVELLCLKVGGTLGTIDVLVVTDSVDTTAPPPATAKPTEAMLSRVMSFLVPVYAVVPAMIDRHAGSLIYVAHPRPRDAGPPPLRCALSSAAIEATMAQLAHWLDRFNIRVNTVLTGRSGTDRAPVTSGEGRAVEPIQLSPLAEPDDIARTVALLATDEFSAVTGATIPVAGAHAR